MKVKFFLKPATLLIVALLSILSCTAKAQWEYINRTEGNVTCFARSGPYLYAGTEDEVVYRSENAGESWTKIHSYNPVSIAAEGANVFVGTRDGKIVRSTDHGRNWEYAFYDPSVYNLAALYIHGHTLYAGYSKSLSIVGPYVGGIFRSEDYGKSWDTLHWENAGVNFLYGIGTKLYASWAEYRSPTETVISTDEGDTWEPLNSDLEGRFISDMITYGNIHFAATDAGVFISEDEGDSWNLIGLSDYYIADIAMYGKNLFALSHDDSVFLIYGTCNNGAEWKQISLDGFHNSNPFIYCIEATQTYLYTGTSPVDYGDTITTGGIYRRSLSELGFSPSGWVQKQVPPQHYLLGIWFTDSETGYAVGGPGTDHCIMRTKDQGITWEPLSYPKVNDWLSSVCFADSLHGWVVGYDSTILYTKDGGNSWSRQKYNVLLSGQKTLETVFCIDTNTAWICGGGGTILKTIDGGTTWERQPVAQSFSIFDILFFDADTGFAVGGNCPGCDGGKLGFILRTTDGGNTWSTVHTSYQVSGYYGLDFGNSKTGIVVGSDGAIVATSDGGASWTSKVSGTSEVFNDVCFVTEKKAYAASGRWDISDGGMVLCTEDAGNTWGTQEIPVKHSLNRIFFTNDSTGFIVGYMGTILITSNKGGPVNPIDTMAIPELPGINPVDIEPFGQIFTLNYPNPFSQSTTIKFQVCEYQRVSLKVYNLNGQEVGSLIDKVILPGIYEATWDATGMKEGVYVYRLEVGDYVESRKLVLIRD